MYGPSAGGLRRGIARAISSLPVPVSPISSTLAREGATSRVRWYAARIAALLPTISAIGSSKAAELSVRSNPMDRGGREGKKNQPNNGLRIGHTNCNRPEPPFTRLEEPCRAPPARVPIGPQKDAVHPSAARPFPLAQNRRDLLRSSLVPPAAGRSPPGSGRASGTPAVTS